MAHVENNFSSISDVTLIEVISTKLTLCFITHNIDKLDNIYVFYNLELLVLRCEIQIQCSCDQQNRIIIIHQGRNDWAKWWNSANYHVNLVSLLIRHMILEPRHLMNLLVNPLPGMQEMNPNESIPWLPDHLLWKISKLEK